MKTGMRDSTSLDDDLIDGILQGVRQFGLSDSEIEVALAEMTDQHNIAVTLRGGLREYLTGINAKDSDYATVDAISRILAESPRGIICDGKYWNDLPEIHLNSTLSQYGYEAEMVAPDGSDISVFLESDNSAQMEIRIEDSKTEMVVTTEFTYPNTELKTNNYPSLIHRVNTEILDLFGVEYVPLKSGENEWRFFLIDSGHLHRLKTEYGDSITFDEYDVGVLANASLEDYLTDPTPTNYDDIRIEREDTGDVADALTTDVKSEETETPEGITISTDPSIDDGVEMGSGVLDLEAINDAGVEPDVDTTLNLDDDVENVIGEAEEMLDEERIDEEIFSESEERELDSDYEPEVTREDFKEEDTSFEEAVKEEQEEDDTITDKITDRLKDLF